LPAKDNASSSAREVARRTVELGDGHADILINNAGIYPFGPTHETSPVNPGREVVSRGRARNLQGMDDSVTKVRAMAWGEFDELQVGSLPPLDMQSQFVQHPAARWRMRPP
jgi:NAD(P)-dependent dehydrogenase (short-subunit alcohol dehydrogenase family)